MPHSASSTVSKYGIALLAIAAALLLRAALTPWMGSTFPLATMFSAVAFTVWYGGWGPALFTAIAGWGGEVFRAGHAWWWVPIVAPPIGAVLGGWVYDLCIGRRFPHAVHAPTVAEIP